MKLILFFFILFSIYPFEGFGTIVPTMIQFGLGSLLVLRFSSFTLNKLLVTLILLYSIVLVEVLIVIIFSQNENIFVLIRTIRLLLSTIILGLLSPIIKKDIIIPILGKAIGLHLIATILFFFIPIIRKYIIRISGYNREILPLRSPGLLSGYDISGLYINILLILLMYTNLLKKYPRLKIIAIIVTSLSTLLISRLTMIVAFFIVIHYLYSNRKSIRLSTKIFIAGIIAFSLFYFKNYILIIFVSTIPILSETIPFLAEFNQSTILNSYSIGSLELLTTDMVFFPEKIISLLFGVGVNPELSDIGYIHLIFYYGLFGSIIIYLTYIKFILSSRVRNRKILSLIFILLIVVHYKLTVISAGGVHEIALILSMIHNDNSL